MIGSETLLFPALGAAGTAGLGWWRALLQGRRLAERAHRLEDQVTRLEQNLRTLEELATHDRLTGAWNRRRFEESARTEMGLARRRRAPASLILLDLDQFKRINDTFGHGAGDQVLVGTTRIVRQALRATDSLTRWGGEEFIVLSPATPLDGATTLAERIRGDLEAETFPTAGAVTLSAGVAEFVHGESLEAWVDRADQALYRAKQRGRNRVEVHAGRSARRPEDTGNLLEMAWDEAFASGNRFVDGQHRMLFDFANALLSSLLGGASLEAVNRRMEELLAHTRRHFRDEEALLRQAGYPDLEAHQDEHARLLLAANQLQAEVRAGRVDFGRLVAYLVSDLVKGHILTEDCHYFSHVNQRLGAEASPRNGPDPG